MCWWATKVLRRRLWSRDPNQYGDHRLVAYVVTGRRELTVSTLRSLLRKRLPAYMLPAAFVFMDKLPRAPNGKVDRLRLPLPTEERPGLGSQFHATAGRRGTGVDASLGDAFTRAPDRHPR